MTTFQEWVSGKTESLNKEIEDIKNNKMETLELRNILMEMKNSLNGLNSRVDMTNEKSPWTWKNKIKMI